MSKLPVVPTVLFGSLTAYINLFENPAGTSPAHHLPDVQRERRKMIHQNPRRIPLQLLTREML